MTVWVLFKEEYKEVYVQPPTPFSVSQESSSDSQHSWKFSKKGDFPYTTKTSKSDLLTYSIWHE